LSDTPERLAHRQLIVRPDWLALRQPFRGLDAPLGGRHLDDGYALLDQPASFTLTGGGRQITVELLAGYGYAQIFAPNDNDYVALEPMTAPTNALTSGSGLQLVGPGGTFRSVFRICVGWGA
jgi:galactose mutarotase-like enzyme